MAALDEDYELGTVFEVVFEASGGSVRVVHDGAVAAEVASTGTQHYFKAGAYTQTNTSRGDDPAAYGEVVVHAVAVEHTDGP